VIYQEFENGNLMNKMINECSLEIAAVKDKFSDYTLISLGEAIIENSHYIIMRGGEDKVILVDPKTLKIFRSL